MNSERIKELARKAWAYAVEQRVLINGDYDDFLKFQESKFAELIVKECAEAGRLAIERAEQYGIRSVSDYVDLKIKEHFGVE